MTTARLVVDGRLTVPLFHGTSTLFCESIRETGLGGCSLLEEMGLGIAIRELLKHEDELQTIPNWDFEKRFMLRIAGVQENPKGSIFRYCGTCVTPSRETALRYATLYECGSEALTCTLKIIKPAVAQLPHLASQQPFSTILAFAEQPKLPVLVEARDVQEEWLHSEGGEPPDAVLDFLQDALQDPDIYDMWTQQSNFELVHPIPSSQLRFYQIAGSSGRDTKTEQLKLIPLPGAPDSH